jgi:hypothetical protein
MSPFSVSVQPILLFLATVKAVGVVACAPLVQHLDCKHPPCVILHSMLGARLMPLFDAPVKHRVHSFRSPAMKLKEVSTAATTLLRYWKRFWKLHRAAKKASEKR